VLIHVKHTGVDIEYLKKMLKTTAFKKEYEKLRNEFKGKYVIGSIEDVPPISGLKEKFLGYEEYLEAVGNSDKKNVLVQVS
jgi:trehalose-6-phosphate synthase